LQEPLYIYIPEFSLESATATTSAKPSKVSEPASFTITANAHNTHPSKLFLPYAGSIVLLSALLTPSLMRGSWKSEEPLLLVLLLITTIGLNLLQYTMSDQFSFSLAIVPELVGLYLLGSPAALLLILATVLTNTIYRIAAGTLKPLAAGGRLIINLSVFMLALAAASALTSLLNIEVGRTEDMWKFFIVVLGFGLVNNLLLVGIVRLASGQWIFSMLSAVKIGYYIFFSFLFIPLIIYSFQDRGLLMAGLLLLALLPIQFISQSSHRLQIQEDALVHDALTGLFNYHNLKTRMTKLLAEQRPFAFALADLDGFKEVNDTYGHVCGNEILKQFSRVFGKMGEPEGALFRYGGDEFCFLTDSKVQLERVLRRWEAAPMKFEWEGNQFTVEFSIGTIYYDGTEQRSFESIIAEADREMYASKLERRS
jgi:diguanylate cyclase (GGDEF)-like protein